MSSKNNLVRRFAMVAMIVLVSLSLNGCCGGGAQMASMLGSAAANCPNGACPNVLQASVTGGLAGCPRANASGPNAGV